MQIATTTSSTLHLFSKDQGFKSKGVRYNLIDISDVLSRTGRDSKEKYGATAVPKKRQHSDDEETPPVKRQKKGTVEVDSTPKAKSVRKLTPSLNKTVSESNQVTKTKVTKPVDARPITTKVTKPEKSITALEACLYETETTKPKGIDLRNLIATAQHKIHEKRHLDHRREHIKWQRIDARIAINQMVATVCFDDHVHYHKDLEQLGYPFIQYEADLLNMFHMWSRSDYNGVTNSVLEKNKTSWCDEDSKRKKQQRSTKGKSMEHSLQDSQITDNGESAESCNERQSSTSVRT